MLWTYAKNYLPAEDIFLQRYHEPEALTRHLKYLRFKMIRITIGIMKGWDAGLICAQSGVENQPCLLIS